MKPSPRQAAARTPFSRAFRCSFSIVSNTLTTSIKEMALDARSCELLEMIAHSASRAAIPTA